MPAPCCPANKTMNGACLSGRQASQAKPNVVMQPGKNKRPRKTGTLINAQTGNRFANYAYQLLNRRPNA